METTTDLITPQRLQDWACSCGLRMGDICREADVSYSTWWRWKNGRSGMGTAVYIRLVDALKTLRDEKQRGRELIERGGDRRQ